MKTINFTKMNGAGNDFILIDANQNKELNLSESLIKQMCDRRKGIGADGILVIKQSEINNFALEYYNSDGKIGSLCGNGARCSIKYAYQNFNVKNDKLSFDCDGENYFGEKLSDTNIKFYLNEPTRINLNIPIKIDESEIIGSFIDNGSPHVVIYWDTIKDRFDVDFSHFPINDIGRKIRYAEEFNPEGTNVNFIQFENDLVDIRTYERGVEEETLACGTGAVAAAIIGNLLFQQKSPVKLKTIGGDLLFVEFVKNNNRFNKISLTGPAKINYIGTFNY